MATKDLDRWLSNLDRWLSNHEKRAEPVRQVKETVQATNTSYPEGCIEISYEEANQLRFLCSHEFFSHCFVAFHEMLRRIDKALDEKGVAPINSKFDSRVR